MTQYKITRERFLGWYFSDSDEISSFGFNCMNELLHSGKINITIQGLIDTCVYIPKWICEGQSIHDEEELSPEDIELIN
jgi:hypothetical protein